MKRHHLSKLPSDITVKEIQTLADCLREKYPSNYLVRFTHVLKKYCDWRLNLTYKHTDFSFLIILFLGSIWFYSLVNLIIHYCNHALKHNRDNSLRLSFHTPVLINTALEKAYTSSYIWHIFLQSMRRKLKPMPSKSWHRFLL